MDANRPFVIEEMPGPNDFANYFGSDHFRPAPLAIRADEVAPCQPPALTRERRVPLAEIDGN